MSLLVGCLALAFPRLAIILVVIFSDYIGNACQTVFWPLIGFIFMPLTVLAYAWAINSNGAVEGFHLVVLVLAVLVDLGLLGNGGHSGHRTVRARQA
jgi:hypothetical protein